jgi:predicted DNA-binding transcriptional regulator AlpA
MSPKKIFHASKEALEVEGNDLLSEIQAAQKCDLKPGTLSVWRSTGRYGLPFVKVGRNVRYRLSDIERWLKNRTHANGATK